jgi:hypothetical protein
MWLHTMFPVLKLFFSRIKSGMARRTNAKCGSAKRTGSVRARSDADEAIDDALAEVNDTVTVLDIY